MLRSILTTAATAALMAGLGGAVQAQAPAAPGTPQAAGRSGANVGSLTCKVAGGMGFIFGSSKDLDCIFARTDGVGEKYTGAIKRYGVDIGFTKESQIVWLVFAPGSIARRMPACFQFSGSLSVKRGLSARQRAVRCR